MSKVECRIVDIEDLVLHTGEDYNGKAIEITWASTPDIVVYAVGHKGQFRIGRRRCWNSNVSFWPGVSYLNYKGIIDKILVNFLHEWNPKKFERCTHKVRKWFAPKLAKYISKSFHPFYVKYLDETTTEEERSVHRAVFKITPRYDGLDIYERYKAVKDNKFLVSDIVNYRAATIYFMESPALAITNRPNSWKLWYTYLQKDINVTTALNKTLMNIPARIPFRHVNDYLRSKKITTPIYGRTKLSALVFLHTRKEQGLRHLELLNGLECLFEKTSNEEFIKANRWLNKRNQGFNFRKVWSIDAFVGWVLDYIRDVELDCSTTKIKLMGIVKRGYNWHQTVWLRQANKGGNINPETKLPKPQFEIFPIKGLKLIEMAGELYKEGHEMEHCVASYVNRFVRGECFIFTYTYNNERATIELDQEGNIRQVRGPKNSDNKAVKQFTRTWKNHQKAKENKTKVKQPTINIEMQNPCGEVLIPF